MPDDKRQTPSPLPSDLPPVTSKQPPFMQPMPHLTGNRRKQKDWVTKAVPIVSVVGWLATFIMLIFLERARPADYNFFSKYYGAPLPSAWNGSLLRVALALLIGVLCVCVIGFIFNMTRHRRKSDKYSKSILLLGAMALIGIAVFLFQFGGLL